MRKYLTKYREIIVYIIAGVLTTIVYYITRFATHIFSDNSVFCACVAQVVSIIFAFFINKYWVFRSKYKSFKTMLIEMVKFAFGRSAMFVFDLLMAFIFIELNKDFFISLMHLESLNYDNFFFRLFGTFIGTPSLLYEFCVTTVTQIIIVIVNYLFSKFFVFKKSRKDQATEPSDELLTQQQPDTTL